MDGEDRLLSVGIDIGTTTTHLVVSSLKFGNLARPTHIAQLGITDKEVLFESPIFETPLHDDGRIDAEAVAQLIGIAYANAAKEAGIDMSLVQTGAVIITGESAGTRNAPEVLAKIANFAGEFVSESAGPALESILCARGSGAQTLSRETGKSVLNLDIGGGTSNFALIEAGEIKCTGAVSIGGRAVQFKNDKISRLSPTAGLLCRRLKADLQIGNQTGSCRHQLALLAQSMASILIGLCRPHGATKDTLAELWLTPVMHLDQSPQSIVISGGVAALMQEIAREPERNDEHKKERENKNTYRDFGIYLADSLYQGLKREHLNFALAESAIRATVLGAGMHTLQLTGSTIDFEDRCLPLRNVPIIRIDASQESSIESNVKNALAIKQVNWSAVPVAIALHGLDREKLQYDRVKLLAEGLARAQADLHAAEPLVFTVDQDIAMVLGQLLKRLVPDKRIISVDGITIEDGDYLDLGKPVHGNSLSDKSTQTLPVVVKTLIFYKN